jgi:hypothetical protein
MHQFYYKYKKRDLRKFFTRIENKISDPNYIDIGCQQGLLLKLDEWPEVVTKKDLKEEGIPSLFYKYPERYELK